jgi:hypothetical protein
MTTLRTISDDGNTTIRVTNGTRIPGNVVAIFYTCTRKVARLPNRRYNKLSASVCVHTTLYLFKSVTTITYIRNFHYHMKQTGKVGGRGVLERRYSDFPTTISLSSQPLSYTECSFYRETEGC